MQTPKSKFSHIDGSPKTAARSSSDSVSISPHQTTRTPKDRSPKMIKRRSTQGRVNEKRSTKLSDLEVCIAQLQEELKKAEDQASSSELQKRQAQQEVEKGKSQISAISAELKETKEQLKEISSTEDDRLQELCKISQERDKSWESELGAVRKQHSMYITALTSAVYEIQKLKKQVEMVTEMEAVQTKRAEFAEEEVRKLQFELGETLMLVERLKADVKQCRDSEVQAQETVSDTRTMLEIVSLSANMVHTTTHEAAQPFSIPSSKSDQSENCKAETECSSELSDKEYINQLESEINNLKSEVSVLQAALNAAEVRYQEEYIQSTLQIRSAYELVEVAKSESRIREAELEAEINRIKSDMNELLAKQTKGAEKPRLSDKENIWAMELKKARASLADTKAVLIEKEKQLQAITEEQENLNTELLKLRSEKARATEDAVVLVEADKVLKSKVIHLTQVADLNSKLLAQLTKQLDAAQAANAEIKVELRRITVQCDQWRKAAEAAAVMLTTGSDKYIDRSESLDSRYHTIGRHLSSPNSDIMDDDLSKKKVGSILQKMTVRWRKSNSNKQM